MRTGLHLRRHRLGVLLRRPQDNRRTSVPLLCEPVTGDEAWQALDSRKYLADKALAGLILMARLDTYQHLCRIHLCPPHRLGVLKRSLSPSTTRTLVAAGRARATGRA